MSGGDEPLECPRCGRRYGPAERFCEECGMPLVVDAGAATEPPSEARLRARKIRPELTRGELVRVARASNQAEAELIQNLLLEEGVPSMTRRSAGFDVPDFLAAGPRDVMVAESGAEAARTALAQGELAPTLARPARPPDRRDVTRLVLALVAASVIAALIAWALLHT